MDEAIRYLNLKVDKDWKYKKFIKINWDNLNNDVNVFWVPVKNCHLWLEKGRVIVRFNREAIIIDKNHFVEVCDNPNYYLLFLNKDYLNTTQWMLEQNLPNLGTEAIIENGDWIEN